MNLSQFLRLKITKKLAPEVHVPMIQYFMPNGSVKPLTNKVDHLHDNRFSFIKQSISGGVIFNIQALGIAQWISLNIYVKPHTTLTPVI